jgi:tRNA pseudouridine55 synthase
MKLNQMETNSVLEKALLESDNTKVLETCGILLVNKEKAKTSFSIISELRRLSKIKKIGHAGTLDPFATGVMVILVGKEFTRKSDSFLNNDKEYVAKIKLGYISTTQDPEGVITKYSDIVPEENEIKKLIDAKFCGKILQTPPMYSAKKVNGKKLYNLARKGITIKREPVEINISTTLIKYAYPYLELKINCSKGTYIRVVAEDIGKELQTGAFLEELVRTRSGSFLLKNCVDQKDFKSSNFDYKLHLLNKIEN